TLGLRCLAAPVYDASGRMVAAMSVSVPSPRFTAERAAWLLNVIRDGAADLSRRLGGTPPAEGDSRATLPEALFAVATS
ncbi:MAG: hypothetical protein M3121_05285, partial [Chloroflexota bacterium]|nr:hypothetical protein [Chloroflexota bacterium]